MTIIQKIITFVERKNNFLLFLGIKKLRFQKFNFFILVTITTIFSAIFFISSNLISKKNQENKKNFKEITKTNDFYNLRNFFVSKITSPYEEVNYQIQVNDTLEKILKRIQSKK